MFVCLPCSEKVLVDPGKGFWPRSVGPCELCGKVRTCNDVPSGAEWAWKKPEPKSEAK